MILQLLTILLSNEQFQAAVQQVPENSDSFYLKVVATSLSAALVYLYFDNKSDRKKSNEAIQRMNERHEEKMEAMIQRTTEALNNNTSALQRLENKLDKFHA